MPVSDLADAPNKKPPATAVGTEEQLGSSAMSDSLSAFSSWQDDIAKKIGSAGSADKAGEALDAWAAKAASDPDVIEAIYRATLMANMGGQLQVRMVEVPESAKGVSLAARTPAPFLHLPFDEAIADFQARRIVTPAQYQAMDTAARQRAFTATNFATQALRDEAYQQLLAALQDGSTLREFSQALRSGEASLGVTPADPSYVETVFRTNIASAYGAGRVQQMQSPTVLQARPYAQYRAIVDNRTTSVCLYLNGIVFDRRTDTGWQRFAPPNHYQCRSTIILVNPDRLSKDDQGVPTQLVNSSEIESRGQPLPPFDSGPKLGLSE